MNPVIKTSLFFGQTIGVVAGLVWILDNAHARMLSGDSDFRGKVGDYTAAERAENMSPPQGYAQRGPASAGGSEKMNTHHHGAAHIGHHGEGAQHPMKGSPAAPKGP